MPELIPLRRGEPIFDARGFGTRRFNEYIEELTSTVNTTTSETETINTQVSSQQQTISQMHDLLKKQDVVVITTVSLTAKPFETIICTNTSAIEITTPINPKKGDIINVKRTGAKVTVIGTVDGKTDKVINNRYYSAKLVYNGTEWSEV